MYKISDDMLYVGGDEAHSVCMYLCYHRSHVFPVTPEALLSLRDCIVNKRMLQE